MQGIEYALLVSGGVALAGVVLALLYLPKSNASITDLSRSNSSITDVPKSNASIPVRSMATMIDLSGANCGAG